MIKKIGKSEGEIVIEKKLIEFHKEYGFDKLRGTVNRYLNKMKAKYKLEKEIKEKEAELSKLKMQK